MGNWLLEPGYSMLDAGLDVDVEVGTSHLDVDDETSIEHPGSRHQT